MGEKNSAKNPGVGDKISIKKKEFYKIHPEKHANRIMAKKGFISKPQKIMYEVLRKKYPEINKECLEYPIKTLESTRFADVALISKNIDFEFDGEEWHDVEEDNLRDKELERVSWETIRFSNLKEVYDYAGK